MRPPTRQFIGSKEQAPEWSVFNPHIKQGYRINFSSVWDASKTLFMAHNETINVHSHLCGAIVYIFMLVYLVLYLPPPSLHQTGLLQRWTYSSFERGRLDTVLCPILDYNSIN